MSLELLNLFAQELKDIGRDAFIADHPSPFLIIDRYEPINFDIRSSSETIPDENVEDSKLLKRGIRGKRLYTSPAAQVVEVTLDKKGMFTLGRNPEGSVMLEHPKISRNHTALRNSGSGDWEVGDIGSTNGTFVDGDRLDRDHFLPIKIGDAFVLAGIVACAMIEPGELFDLSETIRNERHT